MRNSTLHKELHSSAHNQAGTCVTGNTASETRLEDSQGRFAYQFWGTGPWPRTVANFMHCAAFLSKHCWRWPAQSIDYGLAERPPYAAAFAWAFALAAARAAITFTKSLSLKARARSKRRLRLRPSFFIS